MRLWHYRLLPYLPEAQFKGQLRELVAIMRQWRDQGHTNHLLINRVMEYPKADLYGYFLEYAVEYGKRNGDEVPKCTKEFMEFADHTYTDDPFVGWHDDVYLRICMANLLEKHLSPGQSRIREDEWMRLEEGYREITGEEYRI